MSSRESKTFVDYYEVLGIAPTAGFREIRRAYIVKAKKYHPDAGGSIEEMRLLNKAYKTLKDTSDKAAYDLLHGFHTGNTSPGDYRYEDGREVRTVHDMEDNEIDSFLDSLLSEYRYGPPKSKPGLQHWLKKFL